MLWIKMHGCLNLSCSFDTGFNFLLLPFDPLVFVSFLAGGFSLLILMSLFRYVGIFIDYLHVVHIAIVSLNCSQFFQRPKRNCLRTHGGVGSFQITCTWTQPS